MKDQMKKKKIVLRICFIAIWVATVTLCIKVTVFGKTGMKENESYYQTLEKDMVKDVRNFLSDMGYTNSGVMLTRVVNEDESREYTLTVHHHLIDKLSTEERMELEKELSLFYFDAVDCSFSQKFLSYN